MTNQKYIAVFTCSAMLLLGCGNEVVKGIYDGSICIRLRHNSMN